MTMLGNELIYAGEEHVYSYNPTGDFDILLYKVDDGLSVSSVSTAIYDSRVGSNRDFPIALDDEINMEEDNIIQVSFFAFDYDGFLNGTPSIEVTAQPENGSLSQLSGPNISGLIAEWIATYTPNENYFGNDMITFLVTDDNGDSSVLNGTITIIINPVNDAPELSEISDLEFNEDSSGSIELFAEDVDGDFITFSISSGINISSIIDDNSSVIFSPDINWFGTETFTISATDGELVDYESFTITVNPINDAPILISDVSNLSFDEDSSVQLPLYAIDNDGDDLIFEFITFPEVIEASLDGSLLTLSAPTNWNGSENWQISVSDGIVDDINLISVIVNPINDIPQILSVSPNQINASDGYYYTLEVEDVDNDFFTFALLDFPQDMSIDNNGNIEWANIPLDIYYEEFVISVSDIEVNSI